MSESSLIKGIEMPMIGLGTWYILGDAVRSSIKTALDLGYRHIDTAFVYENEREIGEALKEYFNSGKLKREEVFITSKLWATHMGNEEDVRKCFEESRKRLQLDYLDLYLIHLPFGLKNKGDWSLSPRDDNGNLELANNDIIETWHVLEELVAEKKIRYIGLSNFNSEQVERICKHKKSIKPYTNQVECQIYLQQKQLFEFCKAREITLTGYGNFGSPGSKAFRGVDNDGDNLEVLENEVLKQLAAKYKKSTAQIMLRNLIQRDIRVVPKSTNPMRLKENFEIFDFNLNDEDMKAIANVGTVKRLFVLTYNSHDVVVKHPEYPLNAAF